VSDHQCRIRTDALPFKDDNVLHGHSVLGEPDNLGNVCHSTNAIAEPGDLDNDCNGGCDLLAYRFIRQVKLSHQRQRFETRDRVARGVGVNGGH